MPKIKNHYILNRLPKQTGFPTLLALIFVLLCSSSFLVSYFGFTPNWEGEKRTLAEKPTFTWKNRDSFPRKYEAWFNDHFALRTMLIRLNGIIQFGLLKTSTSPRVIRGVDNWLFYNSEESIDDFQKAVPFSPEKRNKIITTLRTRALWAAAHGIPYAVIVAPSKETIYPEKLPAWIKQYGTIRRLDQIVALTAYDSTCGSVIDLRKDLDTARKSKRIYYRYDSHWNGYGAAVAYQRLIEELSDNYALPPLPDTSALSFKELPGSAPSDIGGMIAMQWHLKHTDTLVNAKARDKTSKKPINRILFYHDSFGLAMTPLFVAICDSVIPQHNRWGETFDTTEILKTNPDLLIYEIAERCIFKLDCPAFAKRK